MVFYSAIKTALQLLDLNSPSFYRKVSELVIFPEITNHTVFGLAGLLIWRLKATRQT
jgi:hypothetical protein